jgi:Icc-related predicted phosphoesterase
MPTVDDRVRIAAAADLHFGRGPAGSLQPLLAQVGPSAEVLALCGDLTDHGLPEEAAALVRELAAVKVPVVAVLGNHDYESGKHEEVKQILAAAGVSVLDGDAVEILGIGFAGVKGFAGGFGRHVLAPWGEASIKQLVREAIDEALKLESALARLRTARRVALLHYAPVRDTVEGEPLEIFPFLGCSRLEEPLSRFPVDVVFHGHAHHGKLEGRTQKGVPVYNVALPLLLEQFPDRPPFWVEEMQLAAAPASDGVPVSPRPKRDGGLTLRA